MEDKYIHDAIEVAHGDLHTVKIKKLPAMVVKLDLSKAYDE